MTSETSQNHGNGTLIIVLLISLGLFLAFLTDNFIHLLNSQVSAQLLTQYGAQSPNSSTITCQGNGFSIDYYPSNWTQFDGCTLFSPSQRAISPDAGDPYLRISPAYNLSTPTSIDNLARNITFFTDGGIFHPINPPYYPRNLKVPNAVELDFEWNRSASPVGPPQMALPYVNQFATPTASPIIVLQAIKSANHTAVEPSPPQAAPATINSSKNGTNPTPPNAPPAPYNEVTAAIYFISGNKVYVVEYTASADNFRHFVPLATEMINSFEIYPSR